MNLIISLSDKKSIYTSGSQMILETAASRVFGMWKMQMTGLHPKPIESEPLILRTEQAMLFQALQLIQVNASRNLRPIIS